MAAVACRWSFSTRPNGMKRTLPIETVDSITLLTKAQVSTSCIESCLKRGIPVSFFSKNGRYFGRLLSTGHVNTELQRKQCALYDTDFALALARKIIRAKTKNQLTVLRRYARSKGEDISDLEGRMAIYIDKAQRAENIPELMGHEGQCAKLYFKGLSQCIDSEFAFNGRSRRPPLNPFNSLHREAKKLGGL